MRRRVKLTGYRQHAWDALRAQAWPSAAALANHINCSVSGIKTYIRLLEIHGYIKRQDDFAIFLAKNTGTIAPSVNSQTLLLRDWNLEPSMSSIELKKIIRESGLSLSAWLKHHSFHPAGSTRLRQMLNGQRPVSDDIARAARATLAAGRSSLENEGD